MFMVARTVLFSHTIMFGLLVRGVLVEEKGAVGDVDTAMEVVSSGALNSAKDAVGWGKPCDTLRFHCGDQRSFLVTRADDELTKNKNCRDISFESDLGVITHIDAMVKHSKDSKAEECREQPGARGKQDFPTEEPRA